MKWPKNYFRVAKTRSRSDFPCLGGVIWSIKAVSDFHFGITRNAIFGTLKIAKLGNFCDFGGMKKGISSVTL